MTEDVIVRKNFELLEEFHRYGFEHPEIFDQIPKDAQLIILPENDPELLAANEQIVEKCKREERSYAVFRMRMPERSVPKLVEAA
ncbi:MAG: hypothetical protein HY961_10020 [Ignavibacteriae bacterium]|nr:hypothetical protein [Ignavibacteriota bacterium]